jgi:hypothetical protein
MIIDRSLLSLRMMGWNHELLTTIPSIPDANSINYANPRKIRILYAHLSRTLAARQREAIHSSSFHHVLSLFPTVSRSYHLVKYLANFHLKLSGYFFFTLLTWLVFVLYVPETAHVLLLFRNFIYKAFLRLLWTIRGLREALASWDQPHGRTYYSSRNVFASGVVGTWKESAGLIDVCLDGLWDRTFSVLVSGTKLMKCMRRYALQRDTMRRAGGLGHPTLIWSTLS